MLASIRTLLAAALVVAAALPLAHAGDTGSDCITLEADSFSERLAVIAYGGRELALGVTAPDPGDGIALVAYITPSVCTGLGAPVSAGRGSVDTDVPRYPALP